MATPVPYSGTTEIAPRLDPTPRPSLDTPLAAFGGLVASATEKLGQTADQVGNELYTRAISMEQLHQEALANEASTNATTAMGQAQAKFLTLEGKNAVDSLTDHLQNINDIREKGREGLPSPYAQSLYDRDSRSVQNWNIRASAGHAAQQGKQYYDGSLKAQNQSIDNAALNAPMDDAAFQSAIDQKTATVHRQAVSLGWPPDKEKLETQDEISKLSANRISTIARSTPVEAKKKLDDALKSGQINQLDAARVQELIQKKQFEVTSRHDAANAMAGGNASYGQGIVSMDRASDAIRQKESSGNYSTDVMSFDKSGHEQHALGAYGVMDFNLQPWLKEAGMPAMSAQEFKQNHDAQDQLFAFKFGQLQSKHGSFNGAASEWFGGPGFNQTSSDAFGTTTPKYLQDVNAILARSASRQEVDGVSRKLAENSFPGDADYADVVAKRAEAIHSEDFQIQKDNEFNNKQTVYDALTSGDKNGKLPTSVEELQSISPETAQAWDNMKPTDRYKVLDILAKNAKGDVRWDSQREQRYQELTGMAVHQPDKFLDQDILGEDLPWAAKKEFIKLQSQVYKKAEADPTVSRALGILGPKLQAAGITKSGDVDGLNQFTGALRGAMRAYQDTYKKPPSDDDVQMMGTRLLQKQGAGWFTSGIEQFRTPVPDEAAKAIKDDPKWAEWGIEPTDQDVARIYTRAQFQELYGKQKAQPRP